MITRRYTATAVARLTGRTPPARNNGEWARADACGTGVGERDLQPTFLQKLNAAVYE